VWPDGDLKLRLSGSAAARAPCQHGGVPRGMRGGGGPTLARRLCLELGRILWRRRGEAGLPLPQAWPSAPPTSRSLPRPRRELGSLLVAGANQRQRPAEGVVAGRLELYSLLQQQWPCSWSWTCGGGSWCGGFEVQRKPRGRGMVAGNAVARRRARVEPSAPATTSSTPASSRRHLSGARHTTHKHVHQAKEGALREREEGVGTNCRRAGTSSAGRTPGGQNHGARCPYTFFG
jgi:hypothetical protein